MALAPSIVLVGAAGGDCPGKVYAFDAQSGELVWSREAPAENFFDSQFGAALAVDGTDVLVGAPGLHPLEFGNAYLLDTSTGKVRRRYRGLRRASYFGQSVALRKNRVLVGAPGGSPFSGRSAAYLFAAKTGKLIANFPENPHDDGRGTGTAVALVGRQIVVSEPFEFAVVRVFAR